MFSHVTVGTNDLEVSRKFYDALLGTLGIGPGVAGKSRYFYLSLIPILFEVCAGMMLLWLVVAWPMRTPPAQVAAPV